MTDQSIARTIALAMCIVVAGCASVEPGSAMPGVKLTGQGNDVLLAWMKDSPWAERMPGARLELLADYPTEKGMITGMTLARASAGSAQSATFRLPDTLTPVPQGSLCLYLVRAGDAYPLPVRTAGGQDGTAGFRFLAWERPAVARSQRAALQAERAALQRRMDESTRAVQRLSASECVTRSAAQRMDKPRSVMPATEHEGASSRICVKRLDTTAPLLGKEVNTENVLSFITRALPKLPSSRAAQFDRMARDWNAWKSAVAPPYIPEVGDAASSLPLTSALGLKEVTDEAFAAGLLDAYAVCVHDVRQQLSEELAAWQLIENAGPQREARIDDYLAAQCARREAQLTEARSQVDRLAAHASRLDERLSALPVDPGAPGAPVELQHQSCRRN